MNEETKPVYFKDIFLFLFMFLFFGGMVSLFPEVNVIKWVIFNSILAVLATLIIMIIWKFHKNNSKRYYSLLSFVMLWTLTYYLMSPLFKMIYPSLYFWILLTFTLGYTILLFMNQMKIARAILNPRELWFKKLLLIYLFVFSGVAIVLLIYSNMFDSYWGEMMVFAIVLYLAGFLFLSLSPVFLTRPEMAKKLENMPIDNR